MLSEPSPRRLPIGAEPVGGGVHFRVFAPKRRRVAVVLVDSIERERESELQREPTGHFSGFVPGLAAGARYRLRLDGERATYPDPASRFQPDGPHGASEIVDPAAFRWTDGTHAGVSLAGGAIYELHVGTFTREGTWAAAARELEWLARLGVSVVEMMPVADFPGRFGWGYDGVSLFAPCRLYGAPDDLRRFVDRAHALGLSVILDVVYNHLGPSGNYLHAFSDAYFTDRYANEWGEALDFDGPESAGTRELFLSNARYWIDEFHLDGLRLDATQSIFDRSARHLLLEVGAAVRAAARGRETLVVAENEPQDARLVRPEPAGYALDALWNDDFHHAARVALTGRTEAYYSDYRGTPQELVASIVRGFLYQGQHYSWQRKRRGTPSLDLLPRQLVHYLENHDQVANSARGARLASLSCDGRLRAMTALLLLGPATPMLFQGQEFASSAPFLFFADHEPATASLVRSGRGEFLAQFPSLATQEGHALLADPGSAETFERCKLDPSERVTNAEAVALHRELLALRRRDPVFAGGAIGRDGAVLAEEAFAIRLFGGAGDDRLLLVNLGRERTLEVVPEPLLAPPARGPWELVWSSEEPRYGGSGTPAVERAGEAGGFHLPATAALVLAPAAIGESA